MAKDKLTDYDSTASGNLDVGGISVAEGMLPSGVNNAIRELMSHQASAFGAGTPLYVDQTNNRLGVGNATPSATLDVDGTIKLDGNYPVGTGNVALGDGALDDASLSGAYNTAVGANALTANTTGQNDAFGASTLFSNTTGTFNTAIGGSSLFDNSSGSSNVAVGRSALENNTTASYNTAVGYQAGYNNTTGSYNSAFGQSALNSNSTGNYNTALGTQSLALNTTANENTALGYQAGYSSTTGYYNTVIGSGAGYYVTTGVENTFIGRRSGLYVTTGSKNTILGRYNGNQGVLDIRTSNNNIVLSDGDGTPRYFMLGAGPNVWTTSYTYDSTPFTGYGAVLQVDTSGVVHLDAYSSGGSTGLSFGTNSVGGAISAAMNINYLGTVTVYGALSKGSGSFKIDHPLKPETHHLVHSFVEAPQADNIYRGKVELVSGSATVNIDTVAGMTDGTFAALNREVQCFTSNETGWTAVKGSVSGNVLTITAQDNTCTDTISWLVIGERQDQHMYDTEWTDDNGKVIVEPLKSVEES